MTLIWNSGRKSRRISRGISLDALSNKSSSFPSTRKGQRRYQLSCRFCLHVTVLLSYRSGIVKANTKFPSLFSLEFPSSSTLLPC